MPKRTTKLFIAGTIAAAVIASITACDSTSSSPSAMPQAASSPSATAPQAAQPSSAPMNFAQWYSSFGEGEIQAIESDLSAVQNDLNSGADPTSDAQTLAADAQAGLAEPPPLDASDWNTWLSMVMAEASAAKDDEQLSPASTTYINGTWAATYFENTVAQQGLTVPSN